MSITPLILTPTIDNNGNVKSNYEFLVENNFISSTSKINSLISAVGTLEEQLEEDSASVINYFEDLAATEVTVDDIVSGSATLPGYTLSLPANTYLKDEHVQFISLDKILDTDDFVKMRVSERDFILTLMSQEIEKEVLKIKINDNAPLQETIHLISGSAIRITQLAGETDEDPLRVRFDSNIPLSYYHSSSYNISPTQPDPSNPYRYKINSGPYIAGSLRVYVNANRVPESTLDQSTASIGEFRFSSTLPRSELPNPSLGDFVVCDFDTPLLFGPEDTPDELGNWWGDIITQTDGIILEADSPSKPLRFYPIIGDLNSGIPFQIRSTNPFGDTDNGISTIYLIVDIGEIDHNLLKNYDADRHHLPGSDDQNIWTRLIDTNSNFIIPSSQNSYLTLASDDSSINIEVSSGKVNFELGTINVVDIDGGTIDGTIIGFNDPEDAYFKTIVCIDEDQAARFTKTGTGSLPVVQIEASDSSSTGDILTVKLAGRWVNRINDDGASLFRINPAAAATLPSISSSNTVAVFTNDSSSSDAYITITNNNTNSGIRFGSSTNEEHAVIFANTDDSQLRMQVNASNYIEIDSGLGFTTVKNNLFADGTLTVSGNTILSNTLFVDPDERGYTWHPASNMVFIDDTPIFNLLSDADESCSIFFGDENSSFHGALIYDNNQEELLVYVDSALSYAFETDGFKVYADAPILSNAGTNSSPGFGFVDDPDTGMFLSSVGTLGFAAGGNTLFELNSSTFLINPSGTFDFPSGTLLGVGQNSSPTYISIGTSTNGIGGIQVFDSTNEGDNFIQYDISTHDWQVVSEGSGICVFTEIFDGRGPGIITTAYFGGRGLVNQPSYTFTGDSNTGIYSSGENRVDIACGSQRMMNWNTTTATMYSKVIVDKDRVGYSDSDINDLLVKAVDPSIGLICQDSTAACSITFGNETTTLLGSFFYQPSSSSFFIFPSATNFLILSDTYFSIDTDIRLRIEDGTNASPGLTFNDDLNTGIYRPADDQIGFSAGGTLRAYVDGANGITIAADGASHAVVANTTFRIWHNTTALMSLVSPDAGSSGIFFGDASNEDEAGIFYDASALTLTINVNETNVYSFGQTEAVFDADVEVNVLTLDEQVSTPAGLDDGTEAKVYMRGNNFVIAFNDSGTTKYRWIDLDSTNTTWNYSTSAP